MNHPGPDYRDDPEAPTEPPGNARLETCPECHGYPTGRCWDCQDTGYLLWRACVRCGSDLDWVYVDGRSEAQGMRCWECGTSWTADDPAWQAQTYPVWVYDRLARLGLSR